MIHLLHERATSEQIAEMSEEYEEMIKIVVDIRRHVLCGVAKCMRTVNRSFSKMEVSRMICGVQTGILANKELPSNH